MKKADDVGNLVYDIEGNAGTIRGSYVSFLGDTNGDGIADFFLLDETLSKISIIFGNSRWTQENLSLLNTSSLGNLGYNIFGSDISTIGVGSVCDFNNDGLEDFMFRTLRGSAHNKIYLVFGKRDLSDIVLDDFHSKHGIIFRALEETEHLGGNVQCAGDINGDNISDILIGSSKIENGIYSENGRIYAIFGKSSFPPEIVLRYGNAISYGFIIDDTQFMMTALGDIDYDGYDDIAVSRKDNHIVHLIFGRKEWHNFSLNDHAFTRVIRIVGNEKFSRFGIGFINAGDMNGDGFPDFIVTSSNFALVIAGRSSYTEDIFVEKEIGKTIFVLDSSRSFGRISQFGDINGDGLMDNLVLVQTGIDSIVLILGQRNLSNIHLINTGSHGGYQLYFDKLSFLTQISSSRDFDQDGVNDIALTGISSIVEYSCLFISGKSITFPMNLRVEINAYSMGLMIEDSLGFYGIGDYNGDGVNDIIDIRERRGLTGVTEIGRLLRGKTRPVLDRETFSSPNESSIIRFYDKVSSPTYCYGAYCKYSAVKLGDVNRDGYDDFALFFYSADYSKLFLFFGQRNFYVPKRVDLFDMNIPLSFGVEYKHRTEGDQLFNEMYEVFSAGDVNGDGFIDIIIKMRVKHIDFYQFPLWLYLGNDKIWQSFDHKNAFFLLNDDRVAWVGDVNNDGYDDLLIEKENVVELLLGHSKSFSDDPALWRADHWPRLTVFNASNDPLSSYGVSLLQSAGDINQDGYADFLITLSSRANHKSMVCLFLGNSTRSLTALDSSSSSSVHNPFRRIFIQSEKNVGFADSVYPVDLNVDGYTDLLISSLKRAYIVFGEKEISSMENIAPHALQLINKASGSAVALGDFDNDTLPEVAYGNILLSGKLLQPYFPVRNQSSSSSPSYVPAKIEKNFLAENIYLFSLFGFMVGMLCLSGLLPLFIHRKKRAENNIFTIAPRAPPLSAPPLTRPQVSGSRDEDDEAGIQLGHWYRDTRKELEESKPLL